MKFIDERSIPGDIREFMSLLSDKGIMASHSSDNDFTHYGNLRGVWIVMNEQYEDAIHLMNNPNHLVSNPISSEEAALISQGASHSLFQFSEKFGITCVYIGLAAAVIYIVSTYIKLA